MWAAGTQDLLQGEERISSGIAFNAAAQALVCIGIFRAGGLGQRAGPSAWVSAAFLTFPGTQARLCDESVQGGWIIQQLPDTGRCQHERVIAGGQVNLFEQTLFEVGIRLDSE